MWIWNKMISRCDFVFKLLINYIYSYWRVCLLESKICSKITHSGSFDRDSRYSQQMVQSRETVDWDLRKFVQPRKTFLLASRRKFPFSSSLGIGRSGENRSSDRVPDSGRGRTECAPTISLARQDPLFFSGGFLSLRASFSPPFRRFFAAYGSSSTRRDGIALTTGTLASFSPYSSHAIRLFLHPRTQLRINRGYREFVRFVRFFRFVMF